MSRATSLNDEMMQKEQLKEDHREIVPLHSLPRQELHVVNNEGLEDWEANGIARSQNARRRMEQEGSPGHKWKYAAASEALHSNPSSPSGDIYQGAMGARQQSTKSKMDESLYSAAQSCSLMSTNKHTAGTTRDSNVIRRGDRV